MKSARRNAYRVLCSGLLGLLAACGGGGGGGSSTPPQAVVPPAAPIGKVEAFRFLNQATFGATDAEAARLIGLGDVTNAYSRWIDAEITKPSQLLQPAVAAAYPTPLPTGFNPASLHTFRQEQWFANALRGEDQLRQRVAFALSQIMVVSQVGALNNLPFATADFHDMLARNALGNFRTLLEDVTLHPAMGIYLSMLGNRRAAANTNLRPDENYARELAQLFSVGLVQLNLDGSVRNDAAGQPIPTFGQVETEGFARVFTGWNWACPSTNPTCTFNNTRVELAYSVNFNQVKPMQLYAEQHETGTKQLLNYNGVALPNGLLPANQTGAKDLSDALDNIFNHPNIGPFISKQLIQKLVTSNPSRAYVQRVAERFNNDGSGRRGNLEAVVRAVLLDAEARNPPAGAVAGKLKEPLLRLTQFWRAYAATSTSGKLGVARNFAGGSPTAQFGQGQGMSPSVFNFFSPFYAPPGEISDGGYVSPEMQLGTEILAASSTNYFYTQAFARTQAQAATLNADDMYINTTGELELAADSEALVNRVADKLLGGAGQMSAVLKAETKTQIERTTVPATNPANALATRTADAIYFVVTSPEYALQR